MVAGAFLNVFEPFAVPFSPQILQTSAQRRAQSSSEFGVSCAPPPLLVTLLTTGRAYWKQTRKLARSLAAFEKLAPLNGTSPPGFMAVRQARA